MVGVADLEHVPFPRNAFHKKWGITYCRRCGRVLVKDKDPDFVQVKDCQVVRISLRGH